jgi:erythromycin esterase-like protein
MAENVEEIARFFPRARLMIWAHTGHVSDRRWGTLSTLGTQLRNSFRDQMWSIGVFVDEGGFTAWVAATADSRGAPDTYRVGPAHDYALEGMVRTKGGAAVVVDVTRARREEPHGTFDLPVPAREAGAYVVDDSLYVGPVTRFDEVVVIRKGTPTVLLERVPPVNPPPQ